MVVEEIPADAWKLPEHRDECTLEEIRRGQVINKTAANECPVYNCGKKINENVPDPSPGTIASGLRTHVLFVHYSNRKSAKKRKLGWTTRRRDQISPRKLMVTSSSSALDSALHVKSKDNGQGLCFSRPNPVSKPRLPQSTGTLLNKIQQIKDNKAQSQQMMSLQSLMQATNASNVSPQKQQKANQDSSNSQNSPYNVQSSLFSILAGLTQQQQKTNQPAASLDIKNNQKVPGSSSADSSLASKSDSPINSSFLLLLNEEISGSNVATSLHSQLKKTLTNETKIKGSSQQKQRQSIASPANPPLNDNDGDSSFNNGSTFLNNPGSSFLSNGSGIVNGSSFLNNNNSSLLNGPCTGGSSDNRASRDNSTIILDSFIESIAVKTNSNIGQAGIVEARKIIEKFTSSLLNSSQTIADHYITPCVGEAPQQKPEISPSDIVLAYKMMHKSQP